MAVGAGDVLSVTLNGQLCGQTVMNTFHYGMASVSGAPTQDAVAIEVLNKLAVTGGFYDKFLACCPDNYILNETWVQFILNVRYRKRVGAPSLNGTFGFDADTANVAATISRFGDAANRRNMGSVHIPIGSDVHFLDQGFVKAALLTQLTAFSPFLYTQLVLATLGTIQPILISGASILNAVPLSSAIVQQTARVVRRRTVRVGI